jgi:NACalpha-BTF3-like transcription factor
MMQRMGMNMQGVDDVEEVIIRTPTKEIVIEAPEVAIVNSRDRKSSKSQVEASLNAHPNAKPQKP